ncbi:MAG: hypothetical protein WD875_03400 [Pirellulales bacterium]
MDYEVQRCTRQCSKTGRELLPGEAFFSTLVAEGASLARHDYACEAWSGAPEGVVGWWKSRMPEATTKKAQLAPNDVILQLFDRLAEQPDKADMRYVLALLLVRRRVARAEESETDEESREWMVMYCPRREATLKTLVAMPTDERAAEIQEELGRLLYAQGE